MTHDGENRPLGVTLGGGTTSFTYGPDGARVKKTAATGVTAWPRGLVFGRWSFSPSPPPARR